MGVRKYDREITPRREKFAENFGKHLMNQTEAAREAGFAHPNEYIDRLMADPLVVAKVIEHLRRQAVKWRMLAAKAKAVLMEGMEARKMLKDGTEVVDTSARLEAAKIVLTALRRDKGHLLEDAASEEDNAVESNEDLAKRVIGPPPQPEQTH